MKLKIAICDDERVQTKYLRSLVEKWTHQSDINASVSVFGSAESFLSSHESGEAFDILLLDIQMSGHSGIELDKQVRAAGEDIIIIFITAVSNYFSDGYDVSALHYLLKPIDEAKLFETLDKARSRMSNEQKYLLFSYDGKDCTVMLDQIMYIEAFRHHVIVTTTNGEYQIRRNISSIQAELDDSFFRCQRSYIVGIRHIRNISKTEVTMDDGKIISLSRNVYKDLYKSFIHHFKGGKA